MHFTRLHGIHCIQSRCMESTTFNRDAFYQAAWNPLHSITLHGIHCIQSRCMESTAFNHAAWNPLHSIGMHVPTLHGVHCIQSKCMESTAFNRDAFYQAAWNPCIHASLTLNSEKSLRTLVPLDGVDWRAK